LPADIGSFDAAGALTKARHHCRPAEENPMRRPDLSLVLLALPLLLAACDSHEENEPPLSTAESPFYDAAENASNAMAPPDNAVPAATIPEETMPPVLPDPVDTQELANDTIPSNETEGGR
jgi:hypothetical protein